MIDRIKRAFAFRYGAQGIAKKIVKVVRIVRVVQICLIAMLLTVIGAAVWTLIQPSAAPIALSVAALCLSVPLMVLVGVVTAPLLAKGPIRTAKKISNADLLPATKKEQRQAQKLLNKRAKAAAKAVEAAQKAQAQLAAMEAAAVPAKKPNKRRSKGNHAVAEPEAPKAARRRKHARPKAILVES